MFMDLLVDLVILEQEQAWRVKRNPLSQIRIHGISEDEEDLDKEIFDEREPLGIGGGVPRTILCSSPPKSVAFIDSIMYNADFVEFLKE
jgi:hypothetical protein